tara:strand:+ start:561 stop:908 length:348 start_codon:yes stop_codon:yes gene_type:complete
MGIFSDSNTGICPECGKRWTSYDRYNWFKLDMEYGEYYGGYCSKRCEERSWAATMDFYDVDDPENPQYSNPAHAKPTYSDSSSSSPVEDENPEKPSLLSILFLIYAIAVVIYAFL